MDDMHKLWVGEKVYDRNTGRTGIIKSIDDNEGGLEHDMMVVKVENETESWMCYSFYLSQAE